MRVWCPIACESVLCQTHVADPTSPLNGPLPYLHKSNNIKGDVTLIQYGNKIHSNLLSVSPVRFRPRTCPVQRHCRID